MNRLHNRSWHRLLSVVIVLVFNGGPALGAAEAEKAFEAIFVDRGGLETSVSHVVFYWEEQLSETQLALHELTHIPAKRGTVPIQIHFDRIKQVEFNNSKGESMVSVTLKNGKRGDFSLAIPGSFKGRTEFGDMIAGPTHLRKVVFK